MKFTFENGREFIAALTAVSTHASKDETRPHLNCIDLEVRGDALDMVAADGHSMAIYRFESTQHARSGDGLESVMIPLDIALSILAITKHWRKDVDGTKRIIVIDADACTLAMKAYLSVSWGRLDHTFPPYDHVLPSALVEAFKPVISASLLAVAAQSFDVLRAWHRSSLIPIYIRGSADEMGPICLCSPAAPGLSVVIMPMREAAFEPQTPAERFGCSDAKEREAKREARRKAEAERAAKEELRREMGYRSSAIAVAIKRAKEWNAEHPGESQIPVPAES